MSEVYRYYAVYRAYVLTTILSILVAVGSAAKVGLVRIGWW